MSINNIDYQKAKNVKRIDIRGKVCPMTFVYTKLTLEELESGNILEVILDFPAAIKSIPENCKRQNLAELLEIKRIGAENKTWLLKLKKF